MRNEEREMPRMLKNKKERARWEAEEVGWPKVARVEYWNALPEAISVRCPPFALLSCPHQPSSSFSLSTFFSLSLSLRSPRFASSLLVGVIPPSLSFVFPISSVHSLSLSRSLPFIFCVPFAKLRSIFHLEPRRSLAINPRIHYGL